MPQSLTQLYVHLVFSTRNRRQHLDDTIRPQVHGYLATLIRSLDSSYVVVGGVADHVHIFFELNKTHTPVEFVERVKRESSKFIKSLGPKYQHFYWQRGYAMFTVSPMHLEGVEQYVRRQEEHHHKTTFEEEFRHLLQRNNIKWNEQYVWD